MPRDKLDYEKAINAKYRENALAIREQIKIGDKNALQKIVNYAKKSGEPESAIKAKILSDPKFAATFAIDPKRQNLYEKIAQEFLESQHLANFKKLPQNGDGAIYLTSDGLFLPYKITNKKIGKALDFYWKIAGKEFYASHKYTENSGGAQDHQFHEQVELLCKFIRNNQRRQHLLVICDGGYYTANKMTELEDLTLRRSFACGIEKVGEIVAKICNPQ